MNKRPRYLSALWLALTVAAPGTWAQVPVDADGEVIGAYGAGPATEATIPALDSADLEDLVAPVALYPDDLLAIVLPASTYPLQVVEASRFLDALEENPGLSPDEDWDDSIVALVNYPEAVSLLNEDLDWTWRLGEAVVAQQADVIAAIETFRNRAYAAGNLASDEHQRVSHDEGIIEILPVDEDIIYVPYYEPADVVVYQPRPVYHYYPQPRPVYYYPYPAGHYFDSTYFWGVTTAFTIGWTSNRVHVFHRSYRGHPYYGRRYHDRWWYRRPSIGVYRSVYVDDRRTAATGHHARGDRWRPSRHVRLRHSDGRVTRNTYRRDRYVKPERRSLRRDAHVARGDRPRPRSTRRPGQGMASPVPRERDTRRPDLRHEDRIRGPRRDGERRAGGSRDRIGQETRLARADRAEPDKRSSRPRHDRADQRTRADRSPRSNSPGPRKASANKGERPARSERRERPRKERIRGKADRQPR